MSTSLFRKEAIENNTQRLLGDVLLVRPISFWIFTITALLIVILVSAFLGFGTFARKEMVTGYLIPDKGVIRVHAPISGTINQRYIDEGQYIKKGENLLEVTTERGTKDSLSIQQQLLYRLLDQKANLEERIADEKGVFDSEESRLSIALGNTNGEYVQLEQQLQSQQQEVALHKTQVKKYTKLREKGLVSEEELIRKRNTYFSIKSTYNAMQRQLINKRTEITNTQKQSEQLPLRKNNRLQELQSQYTQLEERIIELKNSSSYVVKAPISGRVTASQMVIGQQVSTSTGLLTIIPENTELFAELFLPSRAIGFVVKGQQVLVRYDAFPYQRYGLYEGKIVQIAETVIHPNEAAIPIPIQEPVYRIKVALDSQSINAYGKEMPLQSGMSIAADIILEKRTLGEWLLEPIYSLKGKL
ncbi:HlyD family efflux transporter periplasmic adaptor subunit [Aquimarina sp. 2201CG1-2-11]|uniref:HlyD family secretion protein n=1 Tax=Aquimarina discodermiae TaxID=3231043 RepID=UPI003462FD3B